MLVVHVHPATACAEDGAELIEDGGVVRKTRTICGSSERRFARCPGSQLLYTRDEVNGHPSPVSFASVAFNCSLTCSGIGSRAAGSATTFDSCANPGSSPAA